MRLIPLADFRRNYFADGRAPDPRVIRAWIDSGELPGRRDGRKYYVGAESFEQSTGNELADRILSV